MEILNQENRILIDGSLDYGGGVVDPSAQDQAYHNSLRDGVIAVSEGLGQEIIGPAEADLLKPESRRRFRLPKRFLPLALVGLLLPVACAQSQEYTKEMCWPEQSSITTDNDKVKDTLLLDTTYTSSGAPGGDPPRQINVRNLATRPRGITTLTGANVYSDNPVWSPDGSKIAYDQTGLDISKGINRRAYDDTKIMVMNRDGSGKVQVTDTPNVSEFRPVWSPDGSMLAFSAIDFPYGSNIYVVGYDGSNLKKVTDFQNSRNYVLEWSKEGNVLIFKSVGDFPKRDIYSVNMSDFTITKLTSASETVSFDLPRISPDGKKILIRLTDYSKEGKKHITNFAMNLDGSERRVFHEEIIPDELYPNFEWKAWLDKDRFVYHPFNNKGLPLGPFHIPLGIGTRFYLEDFAGKIKIDISNMCRD